MGASARERNGLGGCLVGNVVAAAVEGFDALFESEEAEVDVHGLAHAVAEHKAVGGRHGAVGHFAALHLRGTTTKKQMTKAEAKAKDKWRKREALEK